MSRVVVTLKVSPEEKARWVEAAGEWSLHRWLREAANGCAVAEIAVNRRVEAERAERAALVASIRDEL